MPCETARTRGPRGFVPDVESEPSAPTAARRTTSLPERRYLEARAARLADDGG
jgi:hypothetical protein